MSASAADERRLRPPVPDDRAVMLLPRDYEIRLHDDRVEVSFRAYELWGKQAPGDGRVAGAWSAILGAIAWIIAASGFTFLVIQSVATWWSHAPLPWADAAALSFSSGYALSLLLTRAPAWKRIASSD